MRRVIEGERPGRPQGGEGVWFTDGLWGTLEQCWLPQPKDRPTVETIHECLDQVPAWQPLPLSAEDDIETDTDDESTFTAGDPGVFHHPITGTVLTSGDKFSESLIPSSQFLVGPSTIGPLAQESSDVEGTDASRVPFPSRVAPTQPPEKPDLEESGKTARRVSWMSPLNGFRYQPNLPLDSTKSPRRTSVPSCG